LGRSAGLFMIFYKHTISTKMELMIVFSFEISDLSTRRFRKS